MKTWKRTLTKSDKNAKRDLDLELALKDVALKNHALTHLLVWVEAHLRNNTPHDEILSGLTKRLGVKPTESADFIEVQE